MSFDETRSSGVVLQQRFTFVFGLRSMLIQALIDLIEKLPIIIPQNGFCNLSHSPQHHLQLFVLFWCLPSSWSCSTLFPLRLPLHLVGSFLRLCLAYLLCVCVFWSTIHLWLCSHLCCLCCIWSPLMRIDKLLLPSSQNISSRPVMFEVGCMRDWTVQADDVTPHLHNFRGPLCI